MKELIVTKKFNNKKLDLFLYDNFPMLKRNTLFKALRQKDILVNGKRINSNILVYENDVIKVFISDKILEFNLDSIFEDDNILILNKPIDIEVVGDNSLTYYVQKKYTNEVMPCHRLDRNTFGLVLFAKNQKALEILLDKFKQKEIEKHYLAYCYGIPNKESNRLIAYLFKDKKKSQVYICDYFQKGYTKITTSYTILKTNKENNTSILDIKLETGKTHQIRAHLAHIGLPIIGDGKYGINSINKHFGYKTQQLCSYKLKFDFKGDSGILDYLKGKEFKINYTF